ncbi:hypothetical protein LS482_09505 [Sinomicrobium kalidii]|nr:hypothetical protein [Sinomicrobium kalidii]UGU18103.1 hypothetical protein LS482_09505 [Sinomicrobium kalidii]
MDVLNTRILALQQRWEAEAARFLELKESNRRLMEEIANDMRKLRQGPPA